LSSSSGSALGVPASSASIASLLTSPRSLKFSMSAIELVPASPRIDDQRLTTAEQEQRLRLLGEKEKRLCAQRECREATRRAKELDCLHKQSERERLEAEIREAREKQEEEQKRQRLWQIEEFQRQAELRCWEREHRAVDQLGVNLSPRLSATSEGDTITQQEQLRRERLHKREERELQQMKAQALRRSVVEPWAKKEDAVKEQFQKELQSIEADRRKIREAAQRCRAREKMETRASQRSLAAEKELAKQTSEQQARERLRMRRQEELEEAQVRALRERGERERRMREAKEQKLREQELRTTQEMLARAAREDAVKQQFEAKERLAQEAKMRRLLDIEKRKARAEAAEREREQRRRAEDPMKALYFVPPAPKARLERSLSPVAAVGG